MPPTASPALSASQLERLAELGEERTAETGDVLFRVGERGFPLVAIREGEGALVGAVAASPLRYVAVDRESLRSLLFDDGPLSDLLLSSFVSRREALQQIDGVGIEVVGPRSSAATMRMLDYARRNRLPFTWRDPEQDAAAATLAATLDEARLPLVRLPGGPDLEAPSPGEVWRRLGIGLELAPREEVDLLVVGGGPAGLGAAVYGASEGLDTLVVESGALGGQAGSSRRIENYLGFPAGISGAELTGRAVTQ